MVNIINGNDLAELLLCGIKNLEKNRKRLNDLNVFPVPDGDTGTNMVMTLRGGYEAIKDKTSLPLGDIASRFGSSAVYGARGNSGVIVSQFFKGISDSLSAKECANAEDLCEALECGCERAYSSVAKPVEGTMLTVIKDSCRVLRASLPLESINEAVEIFLREAKCSLERTPELLPILKKANVVDSGAAGIVCFFEGVDLGLGGEEIGDTEEVSVPEHIDLSLFDKNSDFSFGYCFETLIQLTDDPENFDKKLWKSKLSELGDSIVITLEGDKVKLHVHSKTPGKVMEFCQQFGEFLTLKIENMSVQNRQKLAESEKAEKFLVREDDESSEFSVVCVATNGKMQKKFSDMGADVSIMSEIAPSSGDFLEAFKKTGAEKILVFPNSSNSIMSAKQAATLYKDAKVCVANSRSVAECYASLSVLDFDGTVEEALQTVNSTISNIYGFTIYRSDRDVTFGSRSIKKNLYFILSDNKILDVADTLEALTVKSVTSILSKHEYEVITLFCGKEITTALSERLSKIIGSLGFDIEVAIVETFDSSFHLKITLE